MISPRILLRARRYSITDIRFISIVIMHKKHSSRDYIIKHIDRKLIIRMRIFVIIFLVTLIIAIVDTIKFDVPIWLLPISLIVWGGIWLVAGRIQKIRFDQNAFKIISSMDRLWVFILILYIVVAILRKQIIWDRVTWYSVTVVTLWVVSGTMFGRTLAMRYAIKAILKTIGIMK